MPAHAKEVYDVTGPAIPSYQHSLRLSWREHLRRMRLVLRISPAGIVVGKLGTATVTLEELDFTLKNERAYRRGVIGLDELLPLLGTARRNGERIAIINECVHILHPSYIQCLQQARAFEDRLIVLINRCASVRQRKSSGHLGSTRVGALYEDTGGARMC